MHYTVYKITNNINGKIYIGKHQTKNLNDSYMGSGKILLQSIEKYGVENFKKEILFQFDNEADMNAKEAEIVTEEFCLREDTYNLCPGGNGGFGYINNAGISKFKGKNHTVETKKIISEKSLGRKLSEETRNKLSAIYISNRDERNRKVSEALSGRKLSTEHRQKISDSIKSLKELTCPHCNKIGKPPLVYRYHFDNCKNILDKDAKDPYVIGTGNEDSGG